MVKRFTYNWLVGILVLKDLSKNLFFLMSRLFRLTTTRECRVLTPIGWGALLVVFCSIMASTTLFVYPFLAPTKPVGGEILVVEHWLPDYALEKVKEQFQKGNYRLLVIVGRKLERGHPLEQYKNSANWMVSKFKDRGIPEGKIMPISVNKPLKKDRTYHKALLVQKKLDEIGLTEISIDVVSLGAHARRTWFLFEKVFSPVSVGVVSIMPIGYNTSRWWLSSAGVRSVISESIAYLYARFIFSPPIKN